MVKNFFVSLLTTCLFCSFLLTYGFAFDDSTGNATVVDEINYLLDEISEEYSDGIDAIASDDTTNNSDLDDVVDETEDEDDQDVAENDREEAVEVMDEEFYISISIEDNGEIIASSRYAVKGETIRLTPYPEEGYVLEYLDVLNVSTGSPIRVIQNSTGSWEFEMPSAKVQVNFAFIAVESDSNEDSTEEDQETAFPPYTPNQYPEVWSDPMNFKDIDSNAWYYDSIKYNYSRRIMIGMSEDEFDPNTTMTRAMIWVALARLNKRDTEGESPWYQLGLSYVTYNGFSDGSDPHESITREQLVVMLYRSIGEPKLSDYLSNHAVNQLSDFDDSTNISVWAEPAMTWAIQSGIICGANGSLNPQDTATRAEVATMLQRYCEL